MGLKFIITVILFFLLALLQMSFLPYFNIMGAIPNLVFVLFFLTIFFEQKGFYYESFFAILIAGFFLDVFLPFYFGISMLALFAVYFLNKTILHFLKEGKDQYLVFYFIPLFLVCFLVYNAIIYAISIFFHFPFNFGNITLVSSLYSLVFAWIGFYVYRKIKYNQITVTQLKLFK